MRAYFIDGPGGPFGTADVHVRVLPLTALATDGMMFPFDFGFIPSTLGDDGDPLDIMVPMDAHAHVGCLIDVRIIGVIYTEQTQDGKKGKE